jgi:hypothetical protein
MYIDYKDQMQQSTLNIVSSFLKQLALRLDCEISEVHDLQKKFRFKGKRPELRDLIDAVVALSRRFPRTYAIFDALDECDTKERLKLLDAINYLGEAGIKVFATCRPHLRDVRQFFQVRNSASIRIEADTEDIKNFLRVKLEETNQSAALKAKIVAKLSLSAQNV